MDPLLWNYVLEKGLEEDLLPMPNFTERRDKDRAVVPQTSLAAPAKMTAIVFRRPGRRTLLSGWASLTLPSPWMPLLALQPCCRRHHSCRCQQCPFRRLPLSPTLVAITITITITLFVAITIARPPPLSPSPSLLLPSPLPLRHPPPPSLPPASLVTITIAQVLAIGIAIALVAVNCLPPLLPSLLPPKPSLSSLHSTLVANAIAHFIPLALFVTHHPYLHRHHLAALTLFVTCSHC
jgi:hypothetical protein